MKILSEKQVTKIRIQYDNNSESGDRDKVFKWLDKRYGVLGYKVIRQGPSPHKSRKLNVGLMVVEVDLD